MKTHFERRIYIKLETADNEPFMVASNDRRELLDKDEITQVGVYILDHVEHVRLDEKVIP